MRTSGLDRNIGGSIHADVAQWVEAPGEKPVKVEVRSFPSARRGGHPMGEAIYKLVMALLTLFVVFTLGGAVGDSCARKEICKSLGYEVWHEQCAHISIKGPDGGAQ